MKLDVNLPQGPTTTDIAAVDAEQAGFAAGWVTETAHDALIGLALAAVRTERLELGSAVAIALARSPMVTAMAANDVQLVSKGRLQLGLGSQVRSHIVNRFSMPWSSPAPRMREYIAALHAIWACWNDGEPLAFRGDFYTHTLMTPFFSPAPNPYGRPQVHLAAVGPLMTEVAGELADGLLCHPFTTERYVREVTRPAVARGRERAGRAADAVALNITPLLVTGLDEVEFARSKAQTQQRIAFYASTPSYRPVLELHGWGDLQSELGALAKAGRWDEMGGLISDDVLDAFAVVGEPDNMAGLITARFGDIADRITIAATGEELTTLGPAIQALLKG
jgi:probable F420-dependent oxidoreductase